MIFPEPLTPRIAEQVENNFPHRFWVGKTVKHQVKPCQSLSFFPNSFSYVRIFQYYSSSHFITFPYRKYEKTISFSFFQNIPLVFPRRKWPFWPRDSRSLPRSSPRWDSNPSGPSEWRDHWPSPQGDKCHKWRWVNTYRYHFWWVIHIHKSQLFWCELQGYYWFWHTAKWRWKITLFFAVDSCRSSIFCVSWWWNFDFQRGYSIFVRPSCPRYVRPSCSTCWKRLTSPRWHLHFRTQLWRWQLWSVNSRRCWVISSIFLSTESWYA